MSNLVNSDVEKLYNKTLVNAKLIYSVETITDAAYTFVLTDASQYKRFSRADAQTVTVPPNSSVAFPVGTQINISQMGAGQVTLVAGSGVTINQTKLKLAAQYSGASLIKVDTDTWDLIGNVTT